MYVVPIAVATAIYPVELIEISRGQRPTGILTVKYCESISQPLAVTFIPQVHFWEGAVSIDKHNNMQYSYFIKADRQMKKQVNQSNAKNSINL